MGCIHDFDCDRGNCVKCGLSISDWTASPSASALVRVLLDGKAHDLSREQAKKLLDDIRQAIGEPDRLPPIYPYVGPYIPAVDWTCPESPIDLTPRVIC